MARLWVRWWTATVLKTLVIVGCYMVCMVHGSNAELSPMFDSATPLATVMDQKRQLRTRVEEMYEILRGERNEFSSDAQLGLPDVAGPLSRETFLRVLQSYREKLRMASLSSGLDAAMTTAQDDDYLEDRSPASDFVKRIIFNPCSPHHCVAKFSSPEARVPYEIPCSTASGFVPKDPQLPLTFAGNFELCETYHFVRAHFCTIQTSFLVAPLLDPEDRSLVPKPKDYLMLGRLFMGKCVARQCNKDLLKKRFLSGVKATAKKIFFNMKKARFDIFFLESYIEQTTEVSCVREDTLEQGEEFESMGTTVFFFLCAFVTVAGVSASAYNVVYPRTRNKYVLSFSWQHSFNSLFNPMKGDLAFLNGVRVVSMMWIVYGHTVLMSTIGVNVPVNNPTAVDDQVQSFIMTYVRGAEYAVDTFFFMSGLLAATGIIDATFNDRLPNTSVFAYISLILIRFIRLTPLYVSVMFFYTKVLPYTGSGPYWLLNNHRKDLEHSCRHWFANIFYINNLYPFGPDNGGGIDGCMGWTWYLANDMQFFLLVPWLCWFFLKQWQSSKGNHPVIRAVRLYGPCLVLVAIQIGITAWLVVKYDVRGTFDRNFGAYIYVKPWCRMSPYIIGCLLAMYRFDHQQALLEAPSEDSAPFDEFGQPRIPEDRQYFSPRWFRKHLTALLAFGLTLLITFSIYDNIKCKAEPEADCHIWFALFSYGNLGEGNWSQAGIASYLALGYPAWGLALALLTNYAANGNGGPVTYVFSHPIFNPLARLTYTVYLIHLICMRWFYSRAPAPAYANPMRQSMDTVALVVLSYATALFLHIMVEKPFSTLLPWCFGYDKDEQRSQRMRATSMPLERELAMVGDVDSEAITIGSPRRRPSVDGVQEPLLQRAH